MESKSHSFGSARPINRPAMSTKPVYNHNTTYSGIKQAGYQKVSGPSTNIINVTKITTNLG